MYIFRWWFPPGNLSSYHLRARCFYHLVVFLGSCPLKCSAPRCLLPLIGLFRACLRPQDSLPPGPRILLRFSLYVRVVFGFFVAFCWRLEDVHETNELKDIYWNVNFRQKRCSVENRYLHIECKKHSGVWTSAVMIVLFTIMPSRNSAAELQTVCKKYKWMVSAL